MGMSNRKTSYPREKIRILLLEGIHPVAGERFAEAGYTADFRPAAMSEDELLEVVAGVHLLGVRSKTHITERVLDASRHLMGIGCYCIGTNQVALDAAAARGVPVFNAPFSNTRSVAELTLAEVVMLARRATHRSMQLHAGTWEKSARGCHEVRNKTIGIVGYGHIGPQVGLLAEAFGMRVAFYDIVLRFLMNALRTMAVLGMVIALAAWLAGPSKLAVILRGGVSRAVSGTGSSMDFGEFGMWVSEHKAGLRIGGVGAGVLALVLWSTPTPGVIAGLAIAVGIWLLLVEFFGREPSEGDSPAEKEGKESVE